MVAHANDYDGGAVVARLLARLKLSPDARLHIVPAPDAPLESLHALPSSVAAVDLVRGTPSDDCSRRT